MQYEVDGIADEDNPRLLDDDDASARVEVMRTHRSTKIARAKVSLSW